MGILLKLIRLALFDERGVGTFVVLGCIVVDGIIVVVLKSGQQIIWLNPE